MDTNELLMQGKIPCEETGIEVKKSICDICTPAMHCGLDVYVKEGRVLKVEGTEGFPRSRGKLCTKGAANRMYLYREDRIQTPLRRTGPRGSGRFEPCTWEEAYTDIARRLNAIKAAEGPEAVMWFTGYSKWYRPWLHRMAHSFGSLNYGTESSCCQTATMMAWKSVVGRECRADLQHANTLFCWGSNPMLTSYAMGQALTDFKERGGKIVVIDPRVTPTSQKVADLHVRIRHGADCALAHGMAHIMIENGWTDQAFLEQYVHGYPEYAAMVREFTPERCQELTGVPAETIRECARLFACGGPTALHIPSAALSHQCNGFNTLRAIISLSVITGGIDREGGMIPSYDTWVYNDAGFDTREKQFINEHRPAGCRVRVGADRYPVWNYLVDECQAMDLGRQIEEGTPYPLHALMAFGMNHRMFPQPQRLLDSLDKLDLVVAADLFMTETCKYADYVLPACTSMERGELKCYSGGLLTCTEPAIPPLYESRHDAQILCELADYLDLDDELLRAGYDATLRYIIADLPVSLEELRRAELPVRVNASRGLGCGCLRASGFETKTGKVELSSVFIRDLAQGEFQQLDPLPVFRPLERSDEYPMLLVAGARRANVIHTRLHKVAWTRALDGPRVKADLHPEDARRLGISDRDTIRITTESGSVTVQANTTYTSQPGTVNLYHGYAEADANELIGRGRSDPYSGFPAYRNIQCRVEKVVSE